MEFLARPISILLRAVIELLGEVLSPLTCASCDAPIASRAVFCPGCARLIAPLDRSDPSDVVAFGAFEGPLAAALRRFKYNDRPDLARPLGHLVRRAVRAAGVCGQVVVPVPLHPRRLAERGYNQAALLARAVSMELGARLVSRALTRARSTPQQALLDRAARQTNVEGAFLVRRPALVRGLRVVLVDDVVTTGSTLGACVQALIEAGAASVQAVVVARAPLGGS